MPKGTVQSFDPEKGFGTLLLETGDEIPFDISASNKREPKLGDVAVVTVGTGYTGKPKAKLVLFELEDDRAPSFAAGLKRLQKHGFFAQWNANQAKAAAKELFDEVPSKLLRAEVGGLFQHYYGDGLSDRGRAEGVITLDWRFGQVTQTPAEDLLALSLAPTGVVIRRDGDSVSLSGQSVDLSKGLEPLVTALNDGLSAATFDRRFYTLDLESEFYVIVLRGHAFAREVRGLSFLKLGE